MYSTVGVNAQPDTDPEYLRSKDYSDCTYLTDTATAGTLSTNIPNCMSMNDNVTLMYHQRSSDVYNDLAKSYPDQYASNTLNYPPNHAKTGLTNYAMSASVSAAIPENSTALEQYSENRMNDDLQRKLSEHQQHQQQLEQKYRQQHQLMNGQASFQQQQPYTSGHGIITSSALSTPLNSSELTQSSSPNNVPITDHGIPGKPMLSNGGGNLFSIQNNINHQGTSSTVMATLRPQPFPNPISDGVAVSNICSTNFDHGDYATNVQNGSQFHRNTTPISTNVGSSKNNNYLANGNNQKHAVSNNYQAKSVAFAANNGSLVTQTPQTVANGCNGLSTSEFYQPLSLPNVKTDIFVGQSTNV